MSKSKDINVKLEELKHYMCNEITQMILDNHQLNDTSDIGGNLSKIQKLKPSKHKMAYRINNNCGKRCYAR